jgi:hypothetical protein
VVNEHVDVRFVTAQDAIQGDDNFKKGVTDMKPTRRMPTLLLTPQQTTESSSELQEQIRRRAYERHEQRGRDDGHDLDDWLHAELEVQVKTKTVAA